MPYFRPVRRAVVVAVVSSVVVASGGSAIGDQLAVWTAVGKNLCALFQAHDQKALSAIAKRRSEKVAIRLRAAALARDLGDRSLDSLVVDIFPTQSKDLGQTYDVDWTAQCGTGSLQLVAALAAQGDDRAIGKIFAALPHTDAGLTLDLCGQLSGLVLPARPEAVMRAAARLEAAHRKKKGQRSSPLRYLLMCLEAFQPSFGEVMSPERLVPKLQETIDKVGVVSADDPSIAEVRSRVISKLLDAQKRLESLIRPRGN